MKKRNRINRASVCLVLLALAVAVPSLAGCGGLEAVETVVKADEARSEKPRPSLSTSLWM